ncbi:DNA mismatch repair protein msh6 [Cichlidogyrus casuarinus]|uniref:DNA mismatch repair protein msh6 n=1 Tax=Cichlidogyrus casuarinus TaxID=1844966 RepID=A0ABD2QKC0_9PLAT
MLVKPMVRIVEGRHPCLGSEVIPNNLLLGCEELPARCVVVTGPNMGGKSTLMRQTALIALLAHLGCKVPADQCELTPIDRIFTRLGASDRLLAGESTFMVELSECASILRHSTPHSLILMDELGRGTSTHDGSALASSVLHYLAEAAPRCLFSTHYHTLVDGQERQSKIGMGHMACMVEEPLADAGGDKSGLDFETVHFLYKFVPGQCPKSYGFNAARLAQIPDKITRYAVRKAREFEKVSTTFTVLRDLLKAEDLSPDRLQQFRKRLDIV